MITPKENDYFITSDLALVSALIVRGYQVVRIDRSNQRRVLFIVQQDKCLGELVSDYFGYKLEIDALTFSNAIKSLKTRIYHT